MADRLFLFALSIGPHCRAARKILDELKAPFDSLEVDILAGPERASALAELALRNPAQTFPTLLGGSRVVAGPLPEDLRRLATRFSPAPGRGAGSGTEADGFSDPAVQPVAAQPTAVQRRYETLAADQAACLFNPDRDWTLKVLAGLMVNEARYGYGSCPGRLATGVAEHDRAIVCPCAFRAEDVAKYGRCHCHLYFSREGPAAPGPVPDRWLRPVETGGP